MIEEEKMLTFTQKLREKQSNCKIVLNNKLDNCLEGWFVTNDDRLYEYKYIFELSKLKFEDEQRYIKCIKDLEYEETLYIEEFFNNEMHNVDLNYSDFEISDIWLMIKLNNDTKIKEKYDFDFSKKVYELFLKIKDIEEYNEYMSFAFPETQKIDVSELFEKYKNKFKKECFFITYENSNNDDVSGLNNEEIPLDLFGNKMSLLFEYNLNNITLPNFPNNGTLQFYISNSDRIFNNRKFQKGMFCVKYVETNLINSNKLYTNELLGIKETLNCSIKPGVIFKGSTYSDVDNYLFEISENNGNIVSQLRDEIISFTDDADGNIGGYVKFINEASIDCENNDNVCLLCLNSSFNKKIFFTADGDSIYFLISKDDLLNKKFDNVICAVSA